MRPVDTELFNGEAIARGVDREERGHWVPPIIDDFVDKMSKLIHVYP